MEKSYFPGYGRCIGCKELISDVDIPNHTLNCRAKPSTTNSKKICSLCSKEFDTKQLKQHMEFCNTQNQSSILSDNNHSGYSTPKGDILTQNENTFHQELITKIEEICVICNQTIDQTDFENHFQSCSNKQKKNSFEEDKKVCPLCKNQFDQSEYENHLQSCSTDQTNSSSKQNQIKIIRKTKEKHLCALCEEYIDQDQYRDHVASCTHDPLLQNSTNDIKSSKSLQKKNSSNNRNLRKEKKRVCTLCSQSFDQSEYLEHVQFCLNDDHQQTNSIQKSKSKQFCGLCEKHIDEDQYRNHVASCPDNHQENASSSSDYSPKNEKKADCFICYQLINQSEYESHVTACAAKLDQKSKRNEKIQCSKCNCSINLEEKCFYEMPCHNHHYYCFQCLKLSLEEFARNREIPICDRQLCDYEFSRHDISSIPLERYLSDRLLKLAKGEQRPFCSKCQFYIHLNDQFNFNDHLEICDDLIPCEYCQLPYSFIQLENHAIQCRNDQSSPNEKFISFILERTKYPFTKEQIRIFIQQQYQNNRNQLNPFTIVNALAEYGATFPYEIPTRECGICMESRPYDDIYVFDCDESHKICYNCYYQSCETKMNSGEMLTCALCSHPLRDGELNQLRIPYEKLKLIRDYQMKKTFEIYSSKTRGIIKCPNENCRWVAEAEDPNERFRVQCPQCLKEFCSLCNQQYHFRTTCQQLPQITQRWFFWCETERRRYLNQRAQQDQQYQKQLTEFNKKNKENENRNNDLRRRYDELMHDEKYKADNCRLCPSCKRVVQRLEGCDAMVCGQDAHGGNLQSGCGAKFNWTQAQTYNATATQQPKQTIMDLPKPDNPVVHHNGVKCDHCQNDVNGIRFDCVHCPALTFCEKCEQQATLDHSRENQAYEQQQHVFKLIIMPEEEATQF